MSSESETRVLALAGEARMRSSTLFMLELLRGLATGGHALALVCHSLPEVPASQLPFSVLSWSEASARRPFGGRNPLRRMLDELKPSVIHVHGASLGLSGRRLIREMRLPVVFTPYDAADRRAVRRLAGHADRVIALSTYQREAMVNHARIPREKVALVPPGLDVSRYSIYAPQISGRIPVIGVAAPLEPGRGQEVFLQSARQLLDSGREARFVVAGDGHSERMLRRQAAELGLTRHVVFVTRLPNYHHVITSFDIFVRAAIAGGLGFSVYEAMAMGKPIVISATEGMLETIRDGETGLFVNKGDATALTSALGKLMDDPSLAARVGLAARESIAEKFSSERLLRDMRRLYAEAEDSVTVKGSA